VAVGLRPLNRRRRWPVTQRIPPNVTHVINSTRTGLQEALLTVDTMLEVLPLPDGANAELVSLRVSLADILGGLYDNRPQARTQEDLLEEVPN